MAYRVMCGVPDAAQCSAPLVAAAHGFRDAVRCHSTHEEAYRCYTRYLRSKGYTQILDSCGCFRPPLNADGTPSGPVLMLGKKSKFGGVLRSGKSTEGAKKARWMAERGGLIY